MFTDIVDSTRHAAGMGDARWRDPAGAPGAGHADGGGAPPRPHDQVHRRRRAGHLRRPARAIRAARTIRDASAGLGLEVRAGLHTGECELVGDDVAGLAVHIGARVMALAGAGEVLTSSTVKDLVAGSDIDFGERGSTSCATCPGGGAVLGRLSARGRTATLGRRSGWWGYRSSRPMRRIAFLTSLIVVCLAPAAHGASSVVVRGAGFGHGIGMSQYGAYGFAQKGSSYRRILSHYYSGRPMSTASSRPVRVLLQASDPYVRVRGASRGPGGERPQPDRDLLASPPPAAGLTLTGGGKRVGTFSSPLRWSPPGRCG